MQQTLPLSDFLKESGPIVDVRSPSEYIQGHIPGSLSLPLFNDEERAELGTVYKKVSRHGAVELGLLFIQQKVEPFLEQANSIKPTRVLCWRGGMRSGFVAHLFALLGLKMHVLQGGYKSYRRWVLKRLNEIGSPNIFILGGLTGSGKTAVLQALKKKGEQVIDLEGLAGHRGSAFGGIGLAPQRSQEQFENNLALELEKIDWSKPVWIEDESRHIGSCYLSQSLYQRMLSSPLFLIECPQEERIKNLLSLYGKASEKQLLEATRRIHKRLGSERTKLAEEFIVQGKISEAFEQLLYYYDKSYRHQLSKRQIIYPFSKESLNLLHS